jgi:hypothetical protein
MNLRVTHSFRKDSIKKIGNRNFHNSSSFKSLENKNVSGFYNPFSGSVLR